MSRHTRQKHRQSNDVSQRQLLDGTQKVKKGFVSKEHSKSKPFLAYEQLEDKESSHGSRTSLTSKRSQSHKGTQYVREGQNSMTQTRYQDSFNFENKRDHSQQQSKSTTSLSITIEKANANKVIKEVECRITSSKKVDRQVARDLFQRRKTSQNTPSASRPTTQEIKFRINADGVKDYLETAEGEEPVESHLRQKSFFSKR